MAAEVLGLLSLVLVLAFQEYVYDINGRRMATPGAGPPAQVEERVIEESGGRRVVERVTRQPGAPPEKVRIEEVKHPDGRVVTAQETYRGDLNGRLVLAEKSTTDFRKSGERIEATTTVARGSINGGLEVVERSEMTGRETDLAKSTDTRILRKDANGGFREAARQVAERTTVNGTVEENVTEYQSATQDGRLEVSGQRVAKETKAADGSVVRQVEIYGMAQPGRASERGQLKLREQQVVERKPGDGKTVVESLSIRRPDGNGQLPKNFTKVSDRVCQDKCQ